MALNVKKNDTVRVISGKAKGKEGSVVKVIPAKNRVIISGIEKVKRHEKPSQTNQTGGIVEKEASIHISNVMVVNSKGEPTRVARIREEGTSSKRISVKDKSLID